MNNEDTIFNNPTKAYAIMAHLVSGHEAITESITNMSKAAISALLPETEDFIISLNNLDIPQRMVNNINNVFELRERLANAIDSGNSTRYDFDLFVMEINDAIRDLTAIGMHQANLVFGQYAIQLSNTFDNLGEVGDKFINLLAEALEQTNELTKQYALL